MISFSAAPTSGLPVPISAIDLTITLPSGMSVTTSGAAGQLDSATVLPGSALGGTNLAYGSYAAATRTVQLSMATTSSSYNGGEFLKLYCNVPSGVVVTLGNLRAPNAPVVGDKSGRLRSGNTEHSNTDRQGCGDLECGAAVEPDIYFEMVI